MPRGKPRGPVELYKPGSGRLRKTEHNAPEREPEIKRDVGRAPVNNEDTDSQNSERRRLKRPEQPLYVPKVVAKARESEQAHQQQQHEINRNDWNSNVNNDQGLGDRIVPQNISKRYSSRRRPNDGDIQEEFAASRNFRQGSEPRPTAAGMQNLQNLNQNSWSRTRDTRSVEPQVNVINHNYGTGGGGGGEKSYMKPPSGRRHSTIGLEHDKRPKFPPNMKEIPPRFRKQYLTENKITPNYNNQIEEAWDGSTVTFQGSIPPQFHSRPYENLSNQHVTSNNTTYYTLPTRGRGRGRLQNEPNNSPYRSMTPDKMFTNSPINSRSATPNFNTPSRSNDNLYQDSRSQTPVNMPRNEKVDRYDGVGRKNEVSNVNKSPVRRRGTRSPRRTEGRRTPRRDTYDRRKSPNGRPGNISPMRSSPSRKSFGRGIRRDVLENTLKSEVKAPISTFEKADDTQQRNHLPAEPEEKIVFPIVPNLDDALDWSEEVELYVKHLEAEALSDAMTRSSSMASLVETSTKSLPANTRPKSKKKRQKKKRDSGTCVLLAYRKRDQSEESRDLTSDYSRNSSAQRRQRHNSQNSVESRDGFKVPSARRRGSRDNREGSFDSRSHSKNLSRESSFDRIRKSSCNEQENWREEILRTRGIAERDVKKNPDRDAVVKESTEGKKGGLIHLPQKIREEAKPPVLSMTESPKLPETRKLPVQKTLFDPNNPSTPIVVNKPNSRVPCAGFSENTETADQFGNAKPPWHNEHSSNWKQCHFPQLLSDIRRADHELQLIVNNGGVIMYWENVLVFRTFLMESLEFLLSRDLKFAQMENVEQYFWRILYYNIIEMLRKEIASDSKYKEGCKTFLLNLIDEGTAYFERLLDRLENTYNFKISNFIGSNSHQKASGYVNLALISAQKIFIALGDLWRYREQVNETSNYGKCRQMYIKAHEINPKNGRPYNQLAVLAVYSKKKLDAVYYYMRSLMSTNPVSSAQECLITLLDENRKKYEHGERKRREERLERARLHMKEKESQHPKNKHGSLRKETWIRPDGGRRVHRTTSTLQESKPLDSEEEDLAALTSVEVNKRFVTSYLHVHGKLITKIGMETFHETALQMLKEFRALLQHSPIPLPSNRFLQLLALNMFAIESTQLKDPQLESGYRSELQERALVVSLQMFNLILEKCVSLLNDHIKSNPDNLNAIPPDAHELLPSIKIWCDWMLCHTKIWNPPPSTQDFRVGSSGDVWSRLATLMNLFEKLDESLTSLLESEPKEGYEQVRLPEDAALSGFMPLMVNDQKPTYFPRDFDTETAQLALRIKHLVFFGTIFLCGAEPPVLKLEYQNDFSEYVSVVCTTASRSSPNTPPEFNESELLVESFSEDDECQSGETTSVAQDTPSEIQELLSRKVELEKRHRDQELHRQTVQKILQQSVVSVHIEVKPKNLVPDTNCFIDHLQKLKTIASSGSYTLMVPLIVLNELEGLAKGSRTTVTTPRGAIVVDPQHAVMVAESAKTALEFLGTKHPCVKCITTKGNILTSITFTKEDDTVIDANMTNDDRILATCMTLCKGTPEQNLGEPRKLHREIVLLTEDRNLRVKALARDVPVREVPSFLQWAGLG